MRFRTLLAGVAVVGFLATGIPSRVHADEHPRWGDYDDHHNWRNQEWWMNHNPKWVHHHHPEWVGNGDWDRDHEWHDRGWWKHHDHDWAHHHHPDWF